MRVAQFKKFYNEFTTKANCIPQRSELWELERYTALTASDFPAVLRVKDSSSSASAIYQEKKNWTLKLNEPTERKFVSFAMQRGIDLEPVALEFFHRDFMGGQGEMLADFPLIRETDGPWARKDAVPYLAASLDGVYLDEEIDEVSIVEVKCPDRVQIKESWVAQLLGQMDVLQIDTGYLVVFSGGKGENSIVVTVNRDEELWLPRRQALIDFWKGIDYPGVEDKTGEFVRKTKKRKRESYFNVEEDDHVKKRLRVTIKRY